MRELIVFLISNYSLTFLLLGFVAAGTAIARHAKPVPRAFVAERLLRWHVWIAVGLDNLYNFVMHSVFGELSARFIGWANSPFQLEVAFASLGFAVVAFFAGNRSWDARAAAIIGPGMFTLGAAGGHVYQMIHADNFSPGNAGVIFYMDIIVPIIGASLLWFQRREQVVQTSAPDVGRHTA